ncbi:hypothetical protein LPMP_320920 [Leishmania panamensis]|uniref:TFIIH basal transcription factor subunit n=1 Tax=Leishmania panamensis TaxID=5679 RepID=A0A088RY96_LEIPA|nr:hypothetical protein LPMP_320920 [Leishmania panamensis]AIO00979.1 hypothetical protein LPMP_320920 [Leishmania panamensis]
MSSVISPARNKHATCARAGTVLISLFCPPISAHAFVTTLDVGAYAFWFVHVCTLVLGPSSLSVCFLTLLRGHELHLRQHASPLLTFREYTSMDVAGSLEQAWDPSTPGAGALRATAIAQLYFRMTTHHPLTILVVDTMCLVFGADGVTVQELVNYLGITEDRVRFGLEGIPAGMRCTARQLESEGSFVGAAPDALEDEDAVQRDRRTGDGEGGSKETRYYLNYKQMLPLVYAHVTRLLLSACVTDVPPCRYVESVKQAQLAAYQKFDTSNAYAFFASGPPPHAEEAQATSGGVGPSGRGIDDYVDISEAMRRRNAIRGVPCLGCSCYFLVEEFCETLTRCPRCGKDILSLCLHFIQTKLQARVKEKETLVTLLPPVRQMWKRFVAREQSQTPSAAPVSSLLTAETHKTAVHNTAASTGASAASAVPLLRLLLDCTLARDPFLFQQAAAFLSLYSARFASVSDAASVVDVQEILTEREYQDRLRSCASLADQFRSRHRHAASVHVRLISQREIDAARQQESHQKLLKRAMLPPWLRHTAALDELGGSHICASPNSGTASTQGAEMDVAKEPCGIEGSRFGEISKGCVSTGGAVWTAENSLAGCSVAAASAQKRQRAATDTDAKAALTRTASFITAHYYNDEFDAVVLPQLRRVRRTKKEPSIGNEKPSVI